MQPSLSNKEQVTLAFKKLQPSDQKEVYQIITDYIQAENVADEMYLLATESLSDVWDNEENEHWDEFLKENSQTVQ